MAKRKKTGGRQTTLTPQVHAAIVKHVKNGTPQKYAAQAVGVKESVLKNWLRRGRREKSGIYFDLNASLKEAFGEFIASNVKVIQKAGDGVEETTVKETIVADIVTERIVTKKKVFDWAASAWLLERRAQEEFSNAKAELSILKKQLASTNDQLAITNSKLEELIRDQQSSHPSAIPTTGKTSPEVGREGEQHSEGSQPN